MQTYANGAVAVASLGKRPTSVWSIALLDFWPLQTLNGCDPLRTPNRPIAMEPLNFQ
jgi:hypothetical protein